MGSFRAILKHPDDFYPLMKLKISARKAEKQIPAEPHWGFCYYMLHKLSRSFALVIQQLDTDLRDAICIFYLVIRALDTVEDDTCIATEFKIPILMAFHRHIYNQEWHLACGTKEKTISDVYEAFYDFSRMLKSKVDDNDPNARKTKERLEAILKFCTESGTSNQMKSFIIRNKPGTPYNSVLIVIFIILAILLEYMSAGRPTNEFSILQDWIFMDHD